jgi:hypothetical protein
MEKSACNDSLFGAKIFGEYYTNGELEMMQKKLMDEKHGISTRSSFVKRSAHDEKFPRDTGCPKRQKKSEDPFNTCVQNYNQEYAFECIPPFVSMIEKQLQQVQQQQEAQQQQQQKAKELQYVQEQQQQQQELRQQKAQKLQYVQEQQELRQQKAQELQYVQEQQQQQLQELRQQKAQELQHVQQQLQKLKQQKPLERKQEQQKPLERKQEQQKPLEKKQEQEKEQEKEQQKQEKQEQEQEQEKEKKEEQELKPPQPKILKKIDRYEVMARFEKNQNKVVDWIMSLQKKESEQEISMSKTTAFAVPFSPINYQKSVTKKRHIICNCEHHEQLYMMSDGETRGEFMDIVGECRFKNNDNNH